MNRPAAVLLASFLPTLCAACGAHSFSETGTLGPDPAIVGSGRFVTETRPVQSFSRISVTGAAHVIVTHAAVESLEITAEDNLIGLVDSAVLGDRLILGWKSMGSMTTHGLEIRVGVRDLRSVEATGASGFDVDTVDGGQFGVTLTGASTFNGIGSVGRLDLNVTGASRIQTPALTGRTVNAQVVGASTVLLRVSDSLVVTAAGASTVEYFGDPFVQADATGGSVVRRVGP